MSSEVALDTAGVTPERGALGSGKRGRLVRRLRRDRVGVAAGLSLIVLIGLAVVGGPVAQALTGHKPNQQFTDGLTLRGAPLPPFSRAIGDSGRPDPSGPFFILGTDGLGRDVMVRLLYGARVSLLVAFAATAVALGIGATLGLLAGYYRGRLDIVVSRAIETVTAFPSLLFAIGLAAVLGPGLLNSVIVIGLFSWYYPARILRANVLSLRSSQYVEAAISMGMSDARIMRRHLLPHLAAPIIVYGTSVAALNIIFAAGLSYLGVGVAPPTADWGQMLADGVNNGAFIAQPWTAIIPGLALALTTLALNQFGDTLRDALAVKDVG